MEIKNQGYWGKFLKAHGFKNNISPHVIFRNLTECKSLEKKRKIDISVLKSYSKIKLKKKRFIKKFLKNPDKYINLPSTPFPIVAKITAKTIGLDLVSVQPMNAPTGQLFYTDTVIKIKQNHLGIEI